MACPRATRDVDPLCKGRGDHLECYLSQKWNCLISGPLELNLLFANSGSRLRHQWHQIFKLGRLLVSESKEDQTLIYYK